jgi:hypothetical protein
MGVGSVVFGDVLCFHIADEVITDGRVTAELLRPTGKLHGSNYATVNAVERPDLPAELTREVADFDKAHR